MADIKFPNSPTVGQVYIDTTTLYHYQWTGDCWVAFTAGNTSGVPGPQGPAGAPGGFAAQQVAYDLPAGYAAKVDTDPNSPDSAKVFRFGIPAGQRGEKGDIGAQGPAGPIGPQGIQGPQGRDAPIFEFAGIRHNVDNDSTLDSIPIPSSYKPIVITLIYSGNDHELDTEGNQRFAKGEVEMWVYAPPGISTYTALPGDKRGDWISLGAINPVKGDDGAQGPMGPQGPNGTKGDRGDTGAQGAPGPSGPQGLIGDKGPKGDTGAQGPAGNSITLKGVIPGGAWATVAPVGTISELWIAGGEITGFPVAGVPAGKTLPAGHCFTWDGNEWGDLGNIKGPKGDQGAIGPMGPQGPLGQQGPQGIQGVTGGQGIQGPKGDQGIQGPVGPPGPFLVGMITAWGGGVAPTGWLECNGQSTAAYPVLGGIVGAVVPDLRGEFIRGWDHGKGTDAVGRALLSWQADANKSHTHYVHDPGHAHGNGYAVGSDSEVSWAGRDKPKATWPQNTTHNGTGIWLGHEGEFQSRPRNIALMYIIKHD